MTQYIISGNVWGTSVQKLSMQKLILGSQVWQQHKESKQEKTK